MTHQARDYSQQTQNICITFPQRRPNVFDVGPTLYKCYKTVLCLLGHGTLGERVELAGGTSGTPLLATEQITVSAHTAQGKVKAVTLRGRPIVVNLKLLRPQVFIIWFHSLKTTADRGYNVLTVNVSVIGKRQSTRYLVILRFKSVFRVHPSMKSHILFYSNAI